MRTNFPQRFNTTRRVRGYSFGVVLGIAILCILFASRVGAVTSYAVSPLYAVREWFLHSERGLPSYFRSRAELNTEIQNLKDALGRLQSIDERVHALEEENALLRALPKNGPENPASARIVADVVMRPNDTPYDMLLVQRGSSDGVVAGALVYAGTTVIGMVSRTFPQSSLVTLLSAPGIMTPVYVYGPNIFAQGEGMGGGIMRISVPQGIDLKEGQSVVVPMRGSGVYGHIDHVESDVSRPEQYAFVAAHPILSEVRFVTIDAFPMPHISYDEALSVIKDVAHNSLFAPLHALNEVLPVASSTATTTQP